MKKILILLTLAGTLASCSEKPEFVRVGNVSLVGLKDSLILVNMDYVVYNPNNVRTKLRQSGMQIFYKDALVGHGFLDRQIALAANDTIEVPVRCEIVLDKLNTYYPELLASDSTVFHIKGNGRISFLLNSFTIDMDDEIQLNTKKIIHEEIKKNLGYKDNFKIRSISSDKLPSLSETSLKLQVEARNNLPLDYEISQMKLRFFLDQRKGAVAEWELAEPVKQKANGFSNIPVDVTLSNFDILKQIKFSWLTNKKVNFNILGEVAVKVQEYEFNIPVQDSLTLAL